MRPIDCPDFMKIESKFDPLMESKGGTLESEIKCPTRAHTDSKDSIDHTAMYRQDVVASGPWTVSVPQESANPTDSLR